MSAPASSRAAGLDLIRVAAIGLVLVHHFRHLPGAPEALRWFGLRAYVGVDLFFVLSGWLIGGQLWRELARTGSIALGPFWRRRWLRTLPSYLAVLVVLFGLGRIGAADVPVMALFLQNYLAPAKWLATWSLCIEEHFYLVLPLVAPALLRARSKSRALAWGAALALIALAPLLRFAGFGGLSGATYDDFLDDFYGRSHLRFDGLALGVGLSALATHGSAAWRFLDRQRNPFAAGGLLLVASQWLPALTGATEDVGERMSFYNAVPGFLVVSVGVALLLPWARAWKAPQVLARPLAAIADHAYALYLTHELARDAVTKALGERPLPFAVWLAAAVGGSAVAAAVLRQTVERPGLAWRERNAPKREETAARASEASGTASGG